MINLDSNSITSPVRHIVARVELYDSSSTLLNTFNHNDNLKSITIDRIGNTDRFFGYGICQRANIHVIDINREIEIQAGNKLEIVLGVGEEALYTLPVFYVTRVNRDETTNELSITAYDAIYPASQHSISEIVLPETFTLEGYVAACAAILDLPYQIEVDDDVFQSIYTTQTVNVEGTETLREILDNIAEVTQTIYFIDKDWELHFKRLDKDGEAALIIDKSQYFSLDNKENRRLVAVAHATELGDNLIAKLDVSGTTQYVRNNPFWELVDDVDVRLNNALTAVGGLTINQFECSWRGNYNLEIGDKIGLVTKDDNIVYSYLLCDTIEYDGALKQKTYWNYTSSDAESFDNPTAGVNISAVLKRTYAKVDKVNKQIDLFVSDSNELKEEMTSLKLTTDSFTAEVAQKVEEQNEKISQLEMTPDSITASIKRVEENSNITSEYVKEEIANITSQVESIMTPEEVKLEISQQLESGTNKVTTSTGYVFDKDGLTISKADSDISTQITEDGMTITRSGQEVLVVNNQGVDATNLHATTYLIVGTYSRFEDYDGRTGCFWLG